MVRADRGGVLICVKDDIHYVPVLSGHVFSIEALTVRVNLGSKVIISSIYHPPSSNVEYYENTIKYFDKVLSLGYDNIFVVDFNYNVLKPGVGLQNVNNICNIFGIEQLVHKITRSSVDTTSCIDLCFTNFPEKHLVTDVININFSDHFLVYSVLDLKMCKVASKVIKRRSYNNFSVDHFLHDISNSILCGFDPHVYNDVEEAWNVWYSEFLSICNRHAPLRHYMVKSRSCPWIPKDISLSKLIHQRDALHKRAIKTHDLELWRKYRATHNRVTRRIRASKKHYFYQSINENFRNSKGMWGCLRQLLPSKINRNEVPSELSAHDFNKCFTSIGTNLVTKFNISNMPCMTSNPPNTSFSFSNICDNSVLSNLLNLPDGCCLDVLDLDKRLFKISAYLISRSLNSLFNFSLCSSQVPIDWKRALVTPVYKGKGSKADPSNYRPISFVSVVGKIFEISIKQQLVDFFNSSGIISDNQSAYLRGGSTQTALHTIIEEMGQNIDNEQINALGAIDISKCFDTISHDILLYKLRFYGFTDSNVNWFRSYLTNRMQQVKVGPVISKLQKSLDIAHKWLNDNRLIINTTKSMLVGSKTVEHDNISIKLDRISLPQVTEQKILGVLIDSKLNWKPHIETLERSLSSKLGLLHRVSYFLPVSKLQLIYNAVIQSRFDYGITLWGSCCKTYLCTLQRMQNRCDRIVSKNFDFNVSVSLLIKNLGWMNIIIIVFCIL